MIMDSVEWWDDWDEQGTEFSLRDESLMPMLMSRKVVPILITRIT